MTLLRNDPLGFDQLSVGDEWESPGRTVTQADVTAFAGISGDFNALHIDHESAASSPFRQPVAHGLLGLAIVSGLTSQSPKVDTLAFLEIVEWKFLRPIAFGDTIRVVTRVESIVPQARGRRGIVTWKRQVVNQKRQLVQEGITRTLVRASTKAKSSSRTTNEPE